MIKCQDFTIKNGHKLVKYRAKYFQSKNDRFFDLLFPPNLLDTFKLYRNGYN